MRLTVTRPAILSRLNAALGQRGLEADCILVTPGEGVNFSRVSATAGELLASYGLVREELDAMGVAVPRAYKVEGDTLVNVSPGAGYSGDYENPNPSGMGLVLTHRLVNEELALGVTFADAPGAAVVHVPSGLTAAVSGIWHLLPKGTVDQTVALLKQEVEALGHEFDPSDLWVVLAPGARHGFLIDERGVDKLLPLSNILNDTSEGEIIQTVTDQPRPYSLDLALLFKKVWETHGVPASQIGFDARNTLTERDDEGNLVLPSKRAKDELGETYSSGILAIVVR